MIDLEPYFPVLKEVGGWFVVVYLVRWLTQRWEVKMTEQLELTQSIVTFLHERKDEMSDYRRQVESWNSALVSHKDDFRSFRAAYDQQTELIRKLVKALETLVNNVKDAE